MRTPKQKLPLVAVLAAGLAGPALAGEAGAPAAALDLDECRKIWNLAAGRSDLGRDQAKPYVTKFEDVDTNGDGKITNAEFRAGCEKGFVHPARRSD